jgi:hypothetical protein
MKQLCMFAIAIVIPTLVHSSQAKSNIKVIAAIACTPPINIATLETLADNEAQQADIEVRQAQEADDDNIENRRYWTVDEYLKDPGTDSSLLLHLTSSRSRITRAPQQHEHVIEIGISALASTPEPIKTAEQAPSSQYKKFNSGVRSCGIGCLCVAVITLIGQAIVQCFNTDPGYNPYGAHTIN